MSKLETLRFIQKNVRSESSKDFILACSVCKKIEMLGWYRSRSTAAPHSSSEELLRSIAMRLSNAPELPCYPARILRHSSRFCTAGRQMDAGPLLRRTALLSHLSLEIVSEALSRFLNKSICKTVFDRRIVSSSSKGAYSFFSLLSSLYIYTVFIH